MKDWIGNVHAVHSVNMRTSDEPYDFYATDPKAVELLLNSETFSRNVWEPACGEGHISKVLQEYWYHVYSTDVVDRGFGDGIFDFLKGEVKSCSVNADIITNPPYKYAQQFVEKAIDAVSVGHKVAMFLKLTFLEGNKRQKLFSIYPPKTVYVCADRFKCGKNGHFDSERSAVAYCWMVWEKGFYGVPQLRWLK